MRLFSTEMVSKFHPDKYADQISDSILTEILKSDRRARVACETLVKNDTVAIAGEITTHANVDYEAVVRSVGKSLNYNVGKVINLITTQSPEIRDAVDYAVPAPLERGSTGSASQIIKVGLGGEVEILRA